VHPGGNHIPGLPEWAFHAPPARFMQFTAKLSLVFWVTRRGQAR
jgi:hypothetical protein